MRFPELDKEAVSSITGGFFAPLKRRSKCVSGILAGVILGTISFKGFHGNAKKSIIRIAQG
jgi:hypothetical protein